MSAPTRGPRRDYPALPDPLEFIDYEFAPLEPATRAERWAFEAAIRFLMVYDLHGPRYIKALTVHVPGVEMACRGRCPQWPCLNWRLARAARDRHLNSPQPKEGP